MPGMPTQSGCRQRPPRWLRFPGMVRRSVWRWAAPGEHGGPLMRVLVAEDDRGLREVLARGLRENGYAVDAVADG